MGKLDDKNWQVIGERMPYFGVITLDKFKPEVLDQNAIDDFFATGEMHIALVLEWVRHYFDKDFQPVRCLDFGCGVGRLVIPLAKRFTEVVGVDISKGMLEEAKLNCEKHGLKNVEFVESDDELSKVKGKFDLIHSFIVMQHIDTKRGEKIFKRMLEMLNENGVGVLHFTYAKEDDKLSERVIKTLRENVPLVHGLINLIRGRDFNYPHIPMNQYNLNSVLLMLQESSCDRTVLNFTKHGRDLGIVLMFQKKRNDNPPNFP
jgi:SAM-dependent methyltransferase